LLTNLLFIVNLGVLGIFAGTIATLLLFFKPPIPPSKGVASSVVAAVAGINW
jgi:hypothetical protein